MSNEVALIAKSNIADFLKHEDTVMNTVMQESTAFQGGSFLKFNGNDGDWSYGPKDDETVVDAGTQMIAMISNFRRGFICWKDGTMVEKVLAGWTDPKIAEANLTDHGPYEKAEEGQQQDGWSPCVAIDFLMANGGDNDGEKFEYLTATKSAVNSVWGLVDDYMKVRKMKPGQFPLVELGSVSFEAKSKSGKKIRGGTKYAPKIDVVDWVKVEEIEKLLNDWAVANPETAEGSTSEASSENPANYAQMEQTPVVKEPVVHQPAATSAPAAASRRRMAAH